MRSTFYIRRMLLVRARKIGGVVLGSGGDDRCLAGVIIRAIPSGLSTALVLFGEHKLAGSKGIPSVRSIRAREDDLSLRLPLP